MRVKVNEAFHWAAVILILSAAALSYGIHTSLENLRELLETYFGDR